MNVLSDSPFARTTAALAAWQDSARRALQWAHPSWLAGVLDIDEAAARVLIQAVDPAHRASSLSLLQGVGIALPELESLAAPGPARLDALPPELGLRVLRIRALRFRRSEIRRIVDKTTRASVVRWAGVPLDRLTGETPSERLSAPDIGQLARRFPIPPVAMLDDDALAFEGHSLIRRDLRAGSPCSLLRLALPRDAASARARWVNQVPADIDPHGTDALIAQLPTLMPEWTWLFG